ncbi:methyltransferase domain-containing protein [Gloeobacter morelensis MG652769]|uniref:Methyltransferase domain-containing protein n=1 Tax=Gloeobacter morelensis MG652769 TaxID=2781736 RepID=A0ABY3PKR5_9CYAN|nr:methyltransferase domain-containing protein [Gloeobacter morelensis MG652769]
MLARGAAAAGLFLIMEALSGSLPVPAYRWFAAAFGALLLVSCGPRLVTAQTERPVSEPYTGSTNIFEYPGRDQRLQIDRVMDELQIQAGKTVADIGAGGGWFAVRAARRVRPGGRVYAVEINDKFLATIATRARREGYDNIETVLGEPGDPKLPKGSVDAVLLLKTYHEVADPVALLKNTRLALKPGGLVGIIDRNGTGGDHGLDRSVVIKEAKIAGFELVRSFDFVKADEQDYFLIFKATAS